MISIGFSKVVNGCMRRWKNLTIAVTKYKHVIIERHSDFRWFDLFRVCFFSNECKLIFNVRISICKIDTLCKIKSMDVVYFGTKCCYTFAHWRISGRMWNSPKTTEPVTNRWMNNSDWWLQNARDCSRSWLSSCDAKS